MECRVRQGEVSRESEKFGHGVFTYFLLKGLHGNADDKNSGGDGNSVVTIEEAIIYTRKGVQIFTGNRQNPALARYYNESISMGVVRNSSQTAENSR